MRKIWKKGLILLMAGTMAAGTGTTVLASSDTDQEVVVGKNDKPYLALGKDLTSSQRDTVLDLLGVDEYKLDEYDVIYITNDQEHKYLDDYIPKSEIGTRSLSSVVVIAGKKGSGVQVTTKNIDYCTTGMYENALVTAGITDAQAIVAAPSEISGTAALIGVIEAYSVMTGKEPDQDNVDAAFNEMVVTGEIEESGEEPEQVEGMIANLKEQVASGEISTQKEMEDAIDQAQQQFEITLTPEQQQQLLELLQKLDSIDLNLEDLKQQAQNIYDKLSDMGLDMDSLKEEAGGFFSRIFQAIKDFFTNLFS